MKRLFLVVVILALAFGFLVGGYALAKDDPEQTNCNSNNPTNCPQGAPNASSPICGKGEHVGNPHCNKDKDDATPTPKPTPTAKPTPPLPLVTPSPTATKAPEAKTPVGKTPAPVKTAAPKPAINSLPSTSTN